MLDQNLLCSPKGVLEDWKSVTDSAVGVEVFWCTEEKVPEVHPAVDTAAQCQDQNTQDEEEDEQNL